MTLNNVKNILKADIEKIELLDEVYYNKFVIDKKIIELKGEKKYKRKNNKVKQYFKGELYINNKKNKVIKSFKEYNRLLKILLNSK